MRRNMDRMAGLVTQVRQPRPQHRAILRRLRAEQQAAPGRRAYGGAEMC